MKGIQPILAPSTYGIIYSMKIKMKIIFFYQLPPIIIIKNLFLISLLMCIYVYVCVYL